MKRTPLSPMSPKRRSEMAERKRVREEVLDRDGHTCQFWSRAWDLDTWMIGDLAGVPTKCVGALEVHEIIPRSAWRLGYLEPTNCVTLCSGVHHPWVTDHPAEAHRLGLHGFSYERPL